MEIALVLAIDLVAILGLVLLAQSKQGLERALPFATFVIVLTPIEAAFPMGFFYLSTQRLVVIVLAILYLMQGNRKGSERRGDTGLFKWLILVQVAWGVVSVSQSLVPDMSVKKLLSVLIEYYLLYYIYSRTVARREVIEKILMAMVFALIGCSVWGAFEAYNGYNILDYFPKVSHHWGEGDDDRVLRIHSTFDHAILYGAALAMTITLTLHLLPSVGSSIRKCTLWIGLMLMFLNIYKTGSRGPWLGAMLGCALLLLWGENQTRRLVLYMALLSVAVLIIRPGVWDTIRGLFDNTFNVESSTGSSYSYRFALRDAAVKRLMEHPTTRGIWGYGPESFYNVHLEGTLLGKPHTFLSCDNAWVEFMVESGFVGLTIMIILLFYPMLIAFKAYVRLRGTDRHLNFVLFVNMLMFYIQMYSVGMYSWGQNGMMLWILIAVTMAHASNRFGTHRPDPVQLSNTRTKPGIAEWVDAHMEERRLAGWASGPRVMR